MSGTLVCFVCNADNPTDARDTCESEIQNTFSEFSAESVLDLDTDITTVFDEYAEPEFKTKKELVDFVKERMKTPEQARADIIALCRSGADSNYELFRKIRNLADIGANNFTQSAIDNWDIEEDEFNPWISHQFSVTNLWTGGEKKYAVFVMID